MKIYTKTGDDGTTALIGGSRVPKSHASIESYGTIDELNATLGLAAATPAVNSTLLTQLHAIQSELFVIGSHLATPPDRLAAATWLPQIEQSAITRLESEIDRAESHLTPLKNFILPGGSDLAARLHLARTVCRRAERLVVSLPPPSHPSSPAIILYLNRLSDWLFVQARLANLHAGIPDIPWHNPAAPTPPSPSQ